MWSLHLNSEVISKLCSNIVSVITSSRYPPRPANNRQTSSSTRNWAYCFWIKSSVSWASLTSSLRVEASRLDPNCENAATSRYWASWSFSDPATCRMALTWAADPTLETDNPMETTDLILPQNRASSRKICLWLKLRLLGYNQTHLLLSFDDWESC